MPAPASPGDAGHVLPVAEVPVGALGLGVVVGGAAVVEVAEVGALGGGTGLGAGWSTRTRTLMVTRTRILKKQK